MPSHTLQGQIEALVGTVSDTESLNDWIRAACRFFVDNIPQHEAQKWAAATALPLAGLDVTNKRVLSVTRDLRGCRPVSVELEADVSSGASLHYASSADPVYLIKDGKAYIYPDPESAGLAHLLGYPLDADAIYSATHITGFPLAYEHGVVLYSAIHSRQKQIETKRASFPSVLSAPSFTFSSVTPQDPTAATIATNAAFSIDLSTKFTNLYTYLETDEDLEKAQTEAQAIQTALQEFERESTLELQRVIQNAQLAEQASISDAQIVTETRRFNAAQETQRQIAEYTSKLSKFTQDIQVVVADIQVLLQSLGTLSAQFEQFLLMTGIVQQKGAAQ